jgi:hypothetical protein
VRVNPNPMPDLLAALNRTRQDTEEALRELSSGRRVNQPSDDPAAAAILRPGRLLGGLSLIEKTDAPSASLIFLRVNCPASALCQTSHNTRARVCHPG